MKIIKVPEKEQCMKHSSDASKGANIEATTYEFMFRFYVSILITFMHNMEQKEHVCFNMFEKIVFVNKIKFYKGKSFGK